jgi:hypothetical protein
MLASQKEDEMERSRWIKLMSSIALVMASANSAMAFAQALEISRAAQAAKVGQAAPATQPAPPPAPSPMIKPPDSAVGSGGSNNPDNMPIKRPSQATNDRILHAPPASGANAK